MNPVAFCEELDPEWQAELIAAYLIDMQIEAVMAQDNARKQGESQSQGQNQGQPRGQNRGGKPWRTDTIKDNGTWE